MGERSIKNGQKNSDVFYEQPLTGYDLQKNNNSITFKDEKYIGLMSLIPKRTGTNRRRGFQGPSMQDDAIISLMTKTLFIATCTFNL